MGKKLRISQEEARKMLFDLCPQPRIETVELEKSYGRVAAADITAQENVPPFAKAPLDGYALRGEDTALASAAHPVTLSITEEIAAGGIPHIPVGPGQAAKILTGAPMPEGANVVVRFEETSFTDTEVTFTAPVTPHQNVVPAGDDIAIGRVVVHKGEVLTPPLVGMLAALGYCETDVFQRPRIAILSTGSELAAPTGELPPGKIRNSSYHLIRGYLEQAGAEVGPVEVVADDLYTIAGRLEQALHEYDMVVTTGGVSVGDYDLMLSATEQMGARQLFWKVRFRPGGTMLAAEKGGKLILGLSGNPASASLALHLIGLPFIHLLAGRPPQVPEKIKVRLLTPVEKDSPFGRLVRGQLVIQDGVCCFRSVDSQGNGALSSLLGCDLLAELPPETPPLPAGTTVDAYRI